MVTVRSALAEAAGFSGVEAVSSLSLLPSGLAAPRVSMLVSAFERPGAGLPEKPRETDFSMGDPSV